MLKVFSLIKRREDMSLDEFRTWILEEHAPKGRELPGLREYHVSVIDTDDPALPYHAVTELYFDDEESFKAAFASEAGAAAGADVAAHASDRVRLLTQRGAHHLTKSAYRSRGSPPQQPEEPEQPLHVQPRRRRPTQHSRHGCSTATRPAVHTAQPRPG